MPSTHHRAKASPGLPAIFLAMGLSLSGCGAERPRCLELPASGEDLVEVLATSGIQVSVRPLAGPSASEVHLAHDHESLVDQSGLELRRTALALDFSGFAFEVRRVIVDLESRSGEETLAINDSRLFEGSFAAVPSPVGAVTLRASREGVASAGGTPTRLVLEGSVDKLFLGGEDLVLRSLCLEP